MALAAVAAAAAGCGAAADSPGEQGKDVLVDSRQRQGRLLSLGGRRHSGGSISTLDSSEQQGVGASSMSPAGASAALLTSGSGDLGQLSKGRRNPRQQEQNKQAQQRYRAKRKAQFEELQRKVQLLSEEAAEAQV